MAVPIAADGEFAMGLLAACVLLAAAFSAGTLVLRFDTKAFHVLLVVLFLLATAGAFRTSAHMAHYVGRAYPLQDGLLAALDEFFGFHWPTMLSWFNEHPRAANVAGAAYQSFAWQMFLVPLAMACAGRYRALHRYFLALSVAMVITNLGVYFVPALGAYHYYGIEPLMHPEIALGYGNKHVAEVLGAREGSIVDFARVQMGIVTFPSFHAAYAVLAGWSFWRLGPLRYPGLVLNVSMGLATPLHGSHFVSDLVAGIGVMAASLVIARHGPAAAAAAFGRVRRMSPLLGRREHVGAEVPLRP
jgi:uncharacterized membrane protein (DUF485 family)